MTRNAVVIALTLVLVTTQWTPAGIPQPDAVLYGQVVIDGQPVTAKDDVTVIARVAGVEKPVGVYKMGASSPAGDNYVLRIRLESLADGSPQRDNAALVGQTASIFLKQVDGPEEFIRSFTIQRIGAITNLNLDNTVVPGDCASNKPDINLDDYIAFQACFTGNGAPAPSNCACADLDGDGDVDLLDWGRFQILFTDP